MNNLLLGFVCGYLLIKTIEVTLNLALMKIRESAKYRLKVDKEVTKRLNEMREKANDPDQPWYLAYENPCDNEPTHAATDYDMLLEHCKNSGMPDPLIVKTTKQEFQEEVRTIVQRNIQDSLGKSDDEGWDEEQFGKHPEGEI